MSVVQIMGALFYILSEKMRKIKTDANIGIILKMFVVSSLVHFASESSSFSVTSKIK